AAATKSVVIAAIIGAAGLGVAIGTATIADAKPFTQSPESLKMMCDRYGGSYIGKSGGSGALCSWKDGSTTVCDKNDTCTIVELKAQSIDPSLPVLRPGGVL
ncbi:hypothetical protein C6A85_70685, partial [Mycobacterium sp. ITM-2017-0098]